MQNVTQTRDLWSYRDRSELGSNVVDTHADISGFSVEAVDTILEIGDAEVGVVGTKGFVGGFPGRDPRFRRSLNYARSTRRRRSRSKRSSGEARPLDPAARGLAAAAGLETAAGAHRGLGSGGMGIGGPGSMSIWASVL